MAEATEVLGLDLGGLDNGQALHSTVAVQLALLIAGLMAGSTLF